ncbi:MAG: SPOR domain-containing protein [Planctomycetes bacterium]|nr:SPOR domain-containing protein [Planctomycetota bacterium]
MRTDLYSLVRFVHTGRTLPAGLACDGTRSLTVAALIRTRFLTVAALKGAAVMCVVLLPLVGCVELPPPAREQLGEAEKDFRNREYKSAATKLDDILRAYPEYQQSAEAYYLRAQVRAQQNNKVGALTDAKKCISLSQNSDLSARANATAGAMCYEAGNHKDAIHFFEAALKKLPETPPADLVHFRYATSLQRIGEWRKCRPQYAIVFQRYPGSSLANQARLMFEWPWDYYVIQCGAFREASSANKLAQKLQGNGVSARVEQRQRLGETVHAVCVGSYPKYELAQEALRTVKARSPGATIEPGI